MIRTRLFAAVASTMLMSQAVGPATAASRAMTEQTFKQYLQVSTNSGVAQFLLVQDVRTVTGITGGGVVIRGGVLRLKGISTGNIVVMKGGVLEVSGIVSAAVINVGGAVTISGMVKSLIAVGGATQVTGFVASAFGRGTVTVRKAR